MTRVELAVYGMMVLSCLLEVVFRKGYEDGSLDEAIRDFYDNSVEVVTELLGEPAEDYRDLAQEAFHDYNGCLPAEGAWDENMKRLTERFKDRIEEGGGVLVLKPEELWGSLAHHAERWLGMPPGFLSRPSWVSVRDGDGRSISLI